MQGRADPANSTHGPFAGDPDGAAATTQTGSLVTRSPHPVARGAKAVDIPDKSHESAGPSVDQHLAWARLRLLAGPGETSEAERAEAGAFAVMLIDRLEAMLANTREMITVLAADGSIRYSNKAAGLLTGFGEDVNGSAALEFIHPDDLETAAATLLDSLEHPDREVTAEFRLRFADGSWHEVEATARNRLASTVAGIVVSMRDVTERNQAARTELAAHEAMRDFVALASHELRTPTTVIKGFADTLQRRWEDIPDGERRRYTAELAGAATRLSSLIDDLLILTAADAGVDQVPRVAVPLAAVVAEVVDAFGARPPAVRVDIAPDQHVVANRDQLTRMIANYLDNALRYGAPPIVVSAVDAGVGGCVDLRVADSGGGVPAAFVPQLFGRFSRPDKSASRATGGAGLGLAVVRALARAGGGDAWYEPGDPGDPGGANFWLRLPAPRA